MLFSTIIVGVFVFVLGQIVLKWIIEPTQKLREVISEVVFYLASDHSDIHCASIVEKEIALSAGKNLKRLGARLVSSQQLIPFYNQLRKICGLPKPENIVKASKQLSLISSSMWSDNNDKYDRLNLYRKNVCEYLSVPDPVDDGFSKQDLIDNINEIREINKSRNKAVL
ncbi:MAG: hypothetical protein Q8K42_06785 [Methylobacter sp.]|nr:hypothetical protein [Methylobacter sp.]